MGQILIRQLDNDTLAKLKLRAKANDRSAEAEARMLLKRSLETPREDRPSLMSLVGAGRRDGGMTTEQIAAHLRALRDEWE